METKQGNSSESKDEDEDEEDPEKLKKAREWDDWKDGEILWSLLPSVRLPICVSVLFISLSVLSTSLSICPFPNLFVHPSR